MNKRTPDFSEGKLRDCVIKSEYNKYFLLYPAYKMTKAFSTLITSLSQTNKNALFSASVLFITKV